jgi:dolichol-phosphate mannosyltransferase
MKKLCFGVPVYNEQDGIKMFLSKIDEVSRQIIRKYPELQINIVIADDGSVDQTLSTIEKYRLKNIKKIEIIKFSRNYGHSAAVSALFENINDIDALIILDSDLQDDPVICVEMVAVWLEKKVDCVRVKRGRRAEGLLFRIGVRFFYRAFSFVSKFPSELGVFGLYSKRVVQAFRHFPEKVRYNPGIISMIGFPTEYVVSDRSKRVSGSSRVGCRRLVKLSLVALLSFSSYPIYVMTFIGMVTSALSVFAGLIVVSIKLFTDLAIPGWASLLAAQFFLVGVTIFCVGVLGHYIAIIFEEVKARPKYLIEDRFSYNREE